MSKTILSFGEILWDLFPDGPVLGGAPFNLAYRLNSLGAPAVIVSRLGNDRLGEQALEKAHELGMDTDSIQWDLEYPTGRVHIDLTDPNHPEYDIHTDVAFDYTEPTAEILALAQSADCIAFGTLMQREPKARDTLHQILQAAPNTPKLLDINLRKDCYTKEIIKTSLQQATLLKLNDGEAHELESLFNYKIHSCKEFCSHMVTTWNLHACILTMGEKGAFAANAQGAYAYDPGYLIDLKDSCGAGDAFTAGFLLQWLAESSLDTCVKFGNALGALVATQEGATTPIAKEEVEQFMAQPRERKREPEFIGM